MIFEDLLRWDCRRLTFTFLQMRGVYRSIGTDDGSYLIEAILIIFGDVIGDTGDIGLGLCATQRFLIHFFTDGGFDQIRPGQKDRSCSLYDDRFVRRDGKISSACDTTPHNRRDMRDSNARILSIVSVDTSVVLFVQINIIMTSKI